MAALSVDQFPPIILEKIVTKVQWKIYFRLQRTCRTMEEFIRTNRAVSVCLDQKPYLLWSSHDSGSVEYRLLMNGKFLAVTGLYGARFRQLSPERGIDFDPYYTVVQKYRITCQQLDLKSQKNHSKEECVALLNVLKPTALNLCSYGSQRFEALFEVKELRNVNVSLDMEDAIRDDFSVLKRILSRFRELNIELGNEKEDRGDILNRFHGILQFLHSDPLPNLRKLHLMVPFSKGEILDGSRDLTKKFSSFPSPLIRKLQVDAVMHYDLTYSLGPNKSPCKIRVTWQWASIDYDPIIAKP